MLDNIYISIFAFIAHSWYFLLFVLFNNICKNILDADSSLNIFNNIYYIWRIILML